MKEISRKVMPHPTCPGCWTICITDEYNGQRREGMYGCYDRYALAVAYLLTR